ncbi:uncharacterized protein DUF4304 [Asanoa ferruginea]|uniref:Uncharacterized protein DUF4304 n=1 Tax=Asanoa ferruginea TaxID=53367 RepID=A0A3D9ZG09_9ACTN|nr:DUF4304 domain-containing protein [Asanoa ferruginea]REF96187.1 uncharacterized protein DUF4304 [Asanoa ferruginea]GIF49335.1 hypothetical protein Afe04nite_38740 [Asanoa ferruginea]
MTVQESLKWALRDVVGPVARTHGFKGSGPTWRKSNASGDWAIVNVQSSKWNTSQSLECVINLAVAPEPWLRWEREHLGKGMPKAVSESLGLYRQSLHPSGTPVGPEGWWKVTGPESAATAAQDMVVQLEAAGWPVLERMLTPGGMLDQVRRGDLGFMKRKYFDAFFARAEALLLIDRGHSDALENSLRYALDHCPDHSREHAERFDAWARQQRRAADQLHHRPT